MKKLIALFLILVITSFVVVSKNEMSLEMEIAIEKRGNINDVVHVKPPDFNSEKYKWEYIKDRLFDGETEHVYKIKGPILISLKNASRQDSLIVNEIMQELRIVIPNKTITYFENFVGKSFEVIESKDFNARFKGLPVYSLLGSTILMEFDQDLNRSIIKDSQITINARMSSDVGNISSSRLMSSDTKAERTYPYNIFFDINKILSHNERKKYIQYEFLRSLCFVNDANFISNYSSVKNVFDTVLNSPENSNFTDADKFLLQKLYSDDFIDQFKDYMYANYPWRYASSFVNKKIHEFKVWGIIIGVGVLSFVLIFSYFKDVKYRYSYLNYLFPIYLILLFFLNLDLVYNYLTKFNSVITWQNNILFIIVFPLVVAPLVSFVLWGLDKIFFKGNESFSYQLVLKVIFTFASFLVLILFVFLIEPDKEGLFEFFVPYILFSVALAVGRGILLYLNHFSASLVKEKEVELSRLKEAKAEAEVKMLQSQINPHFLYNALNSIASLAHTDAHKTEKMALSLSDLFRHSINQKGKKVNTLGDEIYLVQNYLEIEQIRFGDRLSFDINVEPELLTLEIPMFVLQPLVENAIKHGISKVEVQGRIILKINKKDKGILISVHDNGPDFPEGLVSGHGLQTVYDLLRFSYGDKAEMSWHKKPQKEIIIHIKAIL